MVSCVRRFRKWTPCLLSASICWSPFLFIAKKLDPKSGHFERISKSWAFACMLCRGAVWVQWLWTICTHWAGLMSRCVRAGLGRRNLVSFMAGGWDMSAARWRRAASLATSYCRGEGRESVIYVSVWAFLIMEELVYFQVKKVKLCKTILMDSLSK